MYLDEFESYPYCTAHQEREYQITLLGRAQFLVAGIELSQADRDILLFLIHTWSWTDFNEIRSALKYLGKWSVSCILSYLISLGYVRERIAW